MFVRIMFDAIVQLYSLHASAFDPALASISTSDTSRSLLFSINSYRNPEELSAKLLECLNSTGMVPKMTGLEQTELNRIE